MNKQVKHFVFSGISLSLSSFIIFIYFLNNDNSNFKIFTILFGLIFLISGILTYVYYKKEDKTIKLKEESKKVFKK